MPSFFATVDPAKAGFKIEIWFAHPGTPASKVHTTMTDSQGKISVGMDIGGATYPLEFHLVLPAGQTVDGVTYEGYTTEIQLLDKTDLSYWDLYPAEVSPPIPPAESLLPAIGSAIAGALALWWGWSPS